MSITDTTTTLDTAWIENSASAFTAGVLSSLATCVTEVEGKLKRGTLSATTAPTLAQVQGWLKRAKLELMADKDYSYARKYAYCDLTAGTYRYAMPGDYGGGSIVIKDTTNDRAIPIWRPDWFDKKFPDPSEETSNEVLVACIKNMELWFAPPPDSSDRIEMEYPRSGAETTADDFSFLPELERFLCCDFACAEAFESLHMFDVSDRFRGKYESLLTKVRRADNRKKKTGRRMCAINVFQEFNAINYQGSRD